MFRKCFIKALSSIIVLFVEHGEKVSNTNFQNTNKSQIRKKSKDKYQR
jgi:hypothetical protein